jgi:hypothetical protein
MSTSRTPSSLFSKGAGRASDSPARLQSIFQVKGNERAAELRIRYWSWEIRHRYLSGDISWGNQRGATAEPPRIGWQEGNTSRWAKF